MNSPRTVNDLIELSAKGDPAADNLLDMIDAGELDKSDASRIAALYEAHK